MGNRLENKIAMVTGAGRGIGQAIALAFAREGADLIVCDLSRDNLKETAEKIRALRRNAICAEADVSDSAAVKRMFAESVAEAGRLDILANNAGRTFHGKVAEMTDEDWDMILRINLNSVFYCCREALKYMTPRNYGKIVNISSVSAKQGGGVWGAANYAAAKAGILGFSKTLAREAAPHNITVNVVAPGVVEIPLPSPDEARLAAKDATGKRAPLGRQGRPEEIADAFVFLASDESSYITGETLDVNGGLYMD